jgi:predicted nuclease of predicted toxin-antitoxin system
VRILLDECIDWRLSGALAGYEVTTVQDAGWAGIQNGELLAMASQRFDAFVTVDRNLSFQQNVPGLRIAIVVLRAKTNRLVDLLPVVPNLLVQLASAKAGTVTIVTA